MNKCAGNLVPTEVWRNSRVREGFVSGSGGRGAFTLIELLIVIAVLSILLAILLPTLFMTNEIARQMVCVGNMHSMGIGFMHYAAEWRRYPINSNYHVVNPNNWVDCGAGFEDWGCSESSVKQGSLWPYTRSLELYKCAVDKYNTYRSFSMNMYVGNGYSAHMSSYPLIYQQGATRPEEMGRHPSQVMVFVEERYPDDPTICYATNNPTLRHMGNFCATFADGSGRPVKVFSEKRIPTLQEETAAVDNWMATHFDFWGVKEGITAELPTP